MEKARGGLWRAVVAGVLGAVGALGAEKANLAECNDPLKFNDQQKRIIVYAYRYGFKQDLGYALAAIAWKESCAGMYRVNFGDPSAGIYHAYIPSVLKLYNERDTRFMQNVYGDLLIRDKAFASKVALDTLISWRRTHKGDLKNMIKSYHKGLRWQKNDYLNQGANEYYEDIVAKIKVLQSVMPTLQQSVDEKRPPKESITYAQSEIRPLEIRPKPKPKPISRRHHTPPKAQHKKPPVHTQKPKVEHEHQPNSQATHKKHKEDNSIFLMQEAPVF
ncbi:hypothetical protein ACFOPX_01875 [Helicobacter baculiformis]|uniref:Transglycosylase SLT domain-containing protein n=1 Tax=Helicobacter baculiformis TaxID=427351 RepID=A0ABV7ZG82_9HELI|nr:hypothetical protein [Helicobacter baculiformis]